TKKNPAPMGLPTLLSASTAKARPLSLGRSAAMRGMPSTERKKPVQAPSAISSMSERSRRKARIVVEMASDIQSNNQATPWQDRRRLHEAGRERNGGQGEPAPRPMAALVKTVGLAYIGERAQRKRWKEP